VPSFPWAVNLSRAFGICPFECGVLHCEWVVLGGTFGFGKPKWPQNKSFLAAVKLGEKMLELVQLLCKLKSSEILVMHH